MSPTLHVRATVSAPQPPIRVGIIGTGFGLRTQLPAFSAREDAQVVHLCGQDLKKTRDLALAHGVPNFTSDYRLLCRAADVDLICIASPPGLHREMVIAALSGQKHVLCEKPLALDGSEARELAARAQKSRRICLVDHQLRFHRLLVAARRFIYSGAIGRPYLVRVHQASQDFFRSESDWRWWYESAAGGGLLRAMGPHLVDLVCYWFGRCLKVDAHLEVLPDTRTHKGEVRRIEVEAAFSAILTMEAGVTATVTATAAACSPGKSLSVSVFGTAGEIH